MFDSYLTQFRRRYKLRIIATAIAAVIFTVLTVSLLTAVLKNTLADSNWLYYPARVLLLALPVVLFTALLWKPYQRFKKSAGAAELENAVPGFDGRVDTYLDMKRRNVDSPFVGLLAKDAARTAARTPVKKVLPTGDVLGPVFASVGMLALAGWLFTALPLDWRASMKQLWMGWFVSDILPERSIAIAPGDTKIRIGDSLFVTATLDGFESGFADLHVKQTDSNASDWEVVAMTPEADGSFSFTLYGVSDPIDYYVSSSFVESSHASVEVVTPARITSVTHDYTYPEWTGAAPATFDEATSISAVAGTQIDITFTTDKPLQAGAVLHDDEVITATTISDSTYKATLTVDNEGNYSIVELQGDARIPLSPQHSISIIEDTKPTVAFSLPGSDWSATAIEEVAVAVEAQDDFSIESVTLNYSVNGASWQQIELNEDNQFEHLFMLEEFYSETGGPLIAGDLISYYAEAKDREQTVSTDMLFIDVRPFERRFTQSQQSGGGGGGGSQQQEQEISQRQKEILVSTFNLIRDSKAENAGLIDPADTATLLSDLQNTLADQADKLAERAEARQLLNEDPDVARFVEFMQEAATSMRPSSEALANLSLEEAVAHQQRALQYLKRAESIFNDITINRNNSSGGGGGASQDMAEMYELEMDLAKNQYESPDSVPEQSAEAAGDAADDAFEKLKELAKRQQKLAEAAAEKEELSEAERWQQEKLKRELEELQQELQQLQREQQQASNEQQGQQGQQSGEQSGQQSGEQSGQQQGQQSGGGSSQSQQAMQSLEEAIEELRRSEENSANMTPEERRQALQSASEKLRQSLEQAADQRQQELQQQLADASDAVRDLAQQQQQTSEQLKEAMKRALEARRENRFESGLDQQQERQLAEQKRQMRRELESIREELQDTTDRFAELAPLTTERLEQAIEELDNNQVAELMGISGDLIEEGMAPQAALREDRINNALQNLQSDLFESSSLAAAESGINNDSDTTVAEATRAIQQLRQALSEALAGSRSEGSNAETVAELQRLERGSGANGGTETDQQAQSEDQSGQGQGQQQGQQQGQGQTGSQGQQGQSQQGQQGQPGSSGAQSTSQLGGSGTWSPQTSDPRQNELAIDGSQAQLIEESISQLQSLAELPLTELSEQARQDLDALKEQLNTGNDAENSRRIEANVRLLLKQLEQLELQIYSDSKEVQATRSKQRIADPEGFDNQTADYFRQLSEPGS